MCVWRGVDSAGGCYLGDDDAAECGKTRVAVGRSHGAVAAMEVDDATRRNQDRPVMRRRRRQARGVLLVGDARGGGGLGAHLGAILGRLVQKVKKGKVGPLGGVASTRAVLGVVRHRVLLAERLDVLGVRGAVLGEALSVARVVGDELECELVAVGVAQAGDDVVVVHLGRRREASAQLSEAEGGAPTGAKETLAADERWLVVAAESRFRGSTPRIAYGGEHVRREQLGERFVNTGGWRVGDA